MPCCSVPPAAYLTTPHGLNCGICCDVGRNCGNTLRSTLTKAFVGSQARRQIFSVNGDGAVVSALATHMGDAEVVVPIVELLHALCRHLQDEHYAKMVVRIAKLDGRRLFQVRGRGEGGAVRRRGGGTQQRRGMEKGGRRGGGGGRVSGAVSFEKSVRELGFEARTLGAAGWGAGFDGEERS